MNDQERIDRLEATVGLQEDLLEKLNRLTSEQQLQLHRLEEELRELRRQLKQMAPSTIRSPDEEEPPPHY